jgi:hypothetical protein
VFGRYVIGGDNELVADLWADAPDSNLALPTNPIANGLLIVAAPRLLRSLEQLVRATAAGFEDRDVAEEEAAWTEAKEIIAEVRGRS